MDRPGGGIVVADTPEEQSLWDSTTPASATVTGAQPFVPNVLSNAIKEFGLNGARTINIRKLENNTLP